MVYPESLQMHCKSTGIIVPTSAEDIVPSWCDNLSNLEMQPSSEIFSNEGDSSTSTPQTVIPMRNLSQNSTSIDMEEAEDKVPSVASESIGVAAHQRSLTISTIYQSSSDNSSIMRVEGHVLIQQRFSHLVRAFRERANKIRRRLEMPPTPSTVSSDRSRVTLGPGRDIPSPVLPSSRSANNSSSNIRRNICDAWRESWERFIPPDMVVDPQGIAYVTWLFCVAACFVYNCVVIPLRATFPYQTKDNVKAWMVADYACDLIYLIDLMLIRPRLMFLEDGFWVRDPKRTRQNYFHKFQFKLDVLSLLPLDFLYFRYGVIVLLRFPRLLKIQTFWEFYTRLDNRVSSPYAVRVARTLGNMMYLIHLNACAYYAFSAWEGLGKNNWVFSGQGNAYIRCFYFATKTATSIGKIAKPENENECLFMTWSWLMGVFIFALLIGQMRDIVATATRQQTEYRKLMDETLEYMRSLNLPEPLQDRVKKWFNFTWQQQRTLDESRITDLLPPKLKTDVAINVHIQTLGKVQLFQDCDRALLRDLVLSLRPVIFLPGDYICRKGEVGKEMYIVKTGMVQVMGNNPGEVLATLGEGSVFGEISLLALDGGNRRTADVRSKGFSNLFVLSKANLNDAIVHYPDAQAILKKKANHLMRQNALRKREESEVIIGNKVVTPKLVHTVMQAVDPSSGVAKLLKNRNTESVKRDNITRGQFQCSVIVHREMSQ